MKTKAKSKPLSQAAAETPVVRLVANVEDLATGLAYNEYQFRKVGGKLVHHLFERNKVADPRALGDALLQRNADLPTDPNKRASLLAELVKAQPRLLKALAPKAGWVDGKHVFVRHTGVSGEPNATRPLSPPRWVADARHRCSNAGDLAGWKSEIASITRWSSRLQLTVAAVAASPLVRLMNLQPFAIVMFGQSSVGKSSAVLVAGSFQGQGTKEAIPNWNLTMPALQETASHFNDHAMLIDETGAAELPKDRLYDLMRRVTYAYAEGADALRHSKSGFAGSKEQADAKGILITTSEHSLDALAALAGKTRDAGEIAGAFNVPATRAGNDTIFDNWPSKVQEDGRKAWTTKKFTILRGACAMQHGTAFKHYIEFLTRKNRDELVAEVRQAMKEFERELALKSEVRAMQHAAKNFALVYAGGVQAIAAGLLPVQRDRLLQSIISCFSDGMAAMGPPRDLEVNATNQLVAGLQAANVPEKSKLGTGNDVIGFRRPFAAEDYRVMFAIKPASFVAWFDDDALAQAALRWLNAQGLLVLREGTQFPDGAVSMEGVVTFEKRTIGSGKRENGRWIRFLDPRPMIDRNS